MLLAGTLLSVLTGSVSWAAATPLLVAGVIGLIWPENTALRAAGQVTATDVEAMLAAFKNGGAPPPA